MVAFVAAEEALSKKGLVAKVTFKRQITVLSMDLL
jgi:hypothetical protein